MNPNPATPDPPERKAGISAPPNPQPDPAAGTGARPYGPGEPGGTPGAAGTPGLRPPAAISLVRRTVPAEGGASAPGTEPTGTERRSGDGGPGGGGASAASAAVADASGVETPGRRARPFSAGERLVNWVARPRVAAPLVVVSLALLGWSFMVRLPAKPILVRARMPAAPAMSGPALSHEEVQALAGRADMAASQVITNVEQLPRLLSVLEEAARARGFVVDLVTRAPVNPVPGIPELARHPVVFRLENNHEHDEPAFRRFLAWLRATSTLGVRVEPGPLTIRSLGNGVATASVELEFISLSAHAKTAAK